MREHIAEAVRSIAAEVRPTARVTIHQPDGWERQGEWAGRDGWGIWVWFELGSSDNCYIATMSVFADWLHAQERAGFVSGS